MHNVPVREESAEKCGEMSFSDPVHDLRMKAALTTHGTVNHAINRGASHRKRLHPRATRHLERPRHKTAIVVRVTFTNMADRR
jgi:hypothetical protein